MQVVINSMRGVEEARQIKTYKRRWYVLCVFCAYVTVQYFIWNTFGPIALSVKQIFRWGNADVALLANWDTILYVLFSMLICWFVQKNGMDFVFVVAKI